MVRHHEPAHAVLRARGADDRAGASRRSARSSPSSRSSRTRRGRPRDRDALDQLAVRRIERDDRHVEREDEHLAVADRDAAVRDDAGVVEDARRCRASSASSPCRSWRRGPTTLSSFVVTYIGRSTTTGYDCSPRRAPGSIAWKSTVKTRPSWSTLSLLIWVSDDRRMLSGVLPQPRHRHRQWPRSPAATNDSAAALASARRTSHDALARLISRSNRIRSNVTATADSVFRQRGGEISIGSLKAL